MRSKWQAACHRMKLEGKKTGIRLGASPHSQRLENDRQQPLISKAVVDGGKTAPEESI